MQQRSTNNSAHLALVVGVEENPKAERKGFSIRTLSSWKWVGLAAFAAALLFAFSVFPSPLRETPLFQRLLPSLASQNSGSETQSQGETELLARKEEARKTVSDIDPDDPALKAQEKQDRWLLENVFNEEGKLKTRGFFVEFGARNGVDHSNTYYLAKRLGWTGILAEASPFEHENITKERRESAVIDGGLCEEEETKPFLHIWKNVPAWGGFASSYDKRRLEHFQRTANLSEWTTDVKCYRLDNVLQRFGVRCIDFLSVDTEGSELEALSAYPFTTVPSRVIGIEVLIGWGREGREEKVIKFMEQRGYKLLKTYVVGEDTNDLFFEPQDLSKFNFPEGGCVDDAVFMKARNACVKEKMCLA